MDTIRKAYISMLTESTDDSIKQLESDLKEKHPQLHSLSLYKSGDNVKLDTIIVKKEHRKAGVGSAVLDDIKKFADKNSKRVILTAGVKDKHWGTTSQSRLDQFYRRNGFVANKGRNKDYSITATHYYDGKSAVNESTEHPMIMLDGELKHRNNSLGQPIHHTDEGIRNFHRWFGDSNSVDEHGRPKVFYHGTGSDVDNFDQSKIGFNNRFGPGFYFTDDKKTFDSYSTSIGGNVLPVYLKTKHTNFDDHLTHDQIDKFHSVLRDKKFPNGYDATKDHETIKDQLKQNNAHALSKLFSNSSLYFSKDDWFRGMKALNIDSIHRKMFGGNEVVVHSPNQIKSAIGNDGTFDHPTKINESVEHPMIMLDGIPRHMNNSEGKPIHPTQEGIYNFHRWFGASKAVDEHGRPQVFYHGTGKDFDHFSHDFTGTGTDAHGSGFYFTKNSDMANTYATSHVLPVYLKLTKPIDRASEKELTRTHIQKMIVSAPNHLASLENFGDVTRSYSRVLRDAVDAYSGSSKFESMSMLHNDFYGNAHKKFLDNFKRHTGHDGVMVKDENIATVFHPSQIKSAIGNDGTFDHPTKITESVEHPMIDVDGELKHRHNSLGQPIHHTDDGIKNFHKWFGASKAVDEQGRPKVLYHSSLKNMDAFDPHGKFMGYTGTSGISLTDNPEMASRYLDRYGSHGFVDGVPHQPFEKNIIPVYAKIEKVIETDGPLKSNIGLGHPLPQNYVPTHLAMGYDTLIRNDAISRGGNVKHSTAKNAIRGKEYVLTSPSQIKSAIGNDGTFDHPTKITEETMKNYTPKDSAMAAYKQVVSEASSDEDLSNIWKTTANQPWHEYMKTVKGVSPAIKQQQGEDSAENDASKKRVNDYLTKYKHLF